MLLLRSAGGMLTLYYDRGAPLYPSVAGAMYHAAGLADAGYEIVDTHTPGVTRAMELWFALQVPEIRVFLWPAIDRHGDLDIRRAMRLMIGAHPADDGIPSMQALAERARLVRAWQQFLECVPLVLAPVSTPAGLPAWLRRAGPAWRHACRGTSPGSGVARAQSTIVAFDTRRRVRPRQNSRRETTNSPNS